MRAFGYSVYIMSSLSRTLYIGVTNDLERRACEHREGKPGSFTVRYNVNRLVYFEEFADISGAISREKELKSLTRKRKIKLVESCNPDWPDLTQKSRRKEAEVGILRTAATRENDRNMAATLPMVSADVQNAECK
jgi:putative endonuclease